MNEPKALLTVDEFCRVTSALIGVVDEKLADKVVAALASAPAAPTQDTAPALTYSSTQATNCAGCGERKHTPLRIDAMGGYVCLTCIDNKLGSLLGEFGHAEPAQPAAGAVPVYIQRDHLAKAMQGPFLCRVEPTQRLPDFVPMYPVAQAQPAEQAGEDAARYLFLRDSDDPRWRPFALRDGDGPAVANALVDAARAAAQIKNMPAGAGGER